MIFLLFVGLVASSVAFILCLRFGFAVALLGASAAGATAVIIAALYSWLVGKRSIR